MNMPKAFAHITPKALPITPKALTHYAEGVDPYYAEGVR